MADSIQISTQELRDAATKISDLNKKLNEDLTSINSSMNDLESTYQSDASTEIRKRMNAMKPTFEKYNTIIAEYVTFLNQTAQNYESTEETVEKNANEVVFK